VLVTAAGLTITLTAVAEGVGIDTARFFEEGIDRACTHPR
jgi:hypothetical protein